LLNFNFWEKGGGTVINFDDQRMSGKYKFHFRFPEKPKHKESEIEISFQAIEQENAPRSI